MIFTVLLDNQIDLLKTFNGLNNILYHIRSLYMERALSRRMELLQRLFDRCLPIFYTVKFFET